jgi:threonine synthase
MRYISTRGASPSIDFKQAILAGLAPDGGLYLPEEWPQLELGGLTADIYAGSAFRVLATLANGAVPSGVISHAVTQAYAAFDHPRIAPLRDLGGGLHLMELFHGPTLAFKDVALQLLGRLMGWALEDSGSWATVIGATSGDTGSAAIAGLAGIPRVRVVILHPKDRTSNVQRLQMTTVADDNVFNVALEGDFDDAQALVKAMFRDATFAREHRLAAVNSINWVRIAAQAVYYVTAALDLDADEVDFAVPTGNFGDVFAGYAARAMGAFRGRLVIATNENDILARTLETGAYEPRAVVPTTSPSMDIQVSSNFERLLFEALDCDGAAVSGLMEDLRTKGRFVLGANALARIRDGFAAHRTPEFDVAAEMARAEREHGLVLDPHTAVGLNAARALKRSGVPMVALATAHAAKFPEAVHRALGHPPDRHPRLAALEGRAERYDVLPNELEAVKSYVAKAAKR